MMDFDFDVVTGPSQASCPAAPAESELEDEQGSEEAGLPMLSTGG